MRKQAVYSIILRRFRRNFWWGYFGGSILGYWLIVSPGYSMGVRFGAQATMLLVLELGLICEGVRNLMSARRLPTSQYPALKRQRVGDFLGGGFWLLLALGLGYFDAWPMVFDVMEPATNRYETVEGNVSDIGQKFTSFKVSTCDKSLRSVLGIGLRYGDRCRVTFLKHSLFVVNIVKLPTKR